MSKEDNKPSNSGENEELITTQTELMQKNVGCELVRNAIKGDEDAFEEIYRLTYRFVFAVARHYLSDDEDIYDAIQDTYTRVYRHLSSLNDAEVFAWWLRKIAENSAKTVLSRKEKVSDELLELEEKIISTEDPMKQSDISLDITEVLESMEPEDAELLAKIYYDKMTVAEIAREKGLADSTVRSRVKAAEKRLRALLRIRGIDKPVYGGDFVSMVTTAFRNAIGTDLLSATVAEEILQNVRGKDTKRGAVISAVAAKERNRAVMRLAGVMVAAALFFALLLFIVLSFFVPRGGDKTADTPSSPETAADTADTPEKEPSIWDKLFGKGDSDDTAASGEDENASSPSVSGANSSGGYASGDSSSPSSQGTESGSSSNNTGNSSSSSSGNNSSGTGGGNTPADSTVFVADCLPEQYNKIGRTADNGYMAAQGGWIYTGIGHITNFNDNDGLWKAKQDGSYRVKLSDTSASYINAVGENIYFLAPNGKITQIRTDGKNQKTLCDLYANELTVVGNFAYFSSYGKKSYGATNKYYKLNLTTLETEVIIENLYDKTVYWVGHDRVFIVDSGAYTISRFFPDTKTTELWYENIMVGGIVTGDYYVAEKLYNLKVKGTPKAYASSHEDTVINSAFYYKEGNSERLYVDYMSFDTESLASGQKRGILNLSDMSFKSDSFGFDSDLYVNGYSYSNIHDGYVYAHNDEGYFVRTKIYANEVKIYK